MLRVTTLLLLTLAMTGAGIMATYTRLDARKADVSPPTLVVNKTDKAPELKSELNETWQAITPVKIATTLNDEPSSVAELRAMHDGEHIWILAQWKDKTESSVKKRWEFNEGQWERAKGDEDRIAFAFNINSDSFAKEGCTALCHDGKFHTKKENATVDMWHWKAARGGVYSHVDDKYVVNDARKGDNGKGAYTDNKNEAGDAPKWIWADGHDKEGAFNIDASEEMVDGFEPDAGYSVPSILLRTPEGSRADIKSRGSWKDGTWTVILKRKLDTGHKDDAKLSVGEANTFTLSLFDNTGASTGDEHSISEPCRIEIKP